MVVVFVSLGRAPPFVSIDGGAVHVGDPPELEGEDTCGAHCSATDGDTATAAVDNWILSHYDHFFTLASFSSDQHSNALARMVLATL